MGSSSESWVVECYVMVVTQMRARMKCEIIRRDNRSTCHNSVRKGEFLSLTTVSGHTGQVQKSHLSIQVRVPSESAK